MFGYSELVDCCGFWLLLYAEVEVDPCYPFVDHPLNGPDSSKTQSRVHLRSHRWHSCQEVGEYWDPKKELTLINQ